MIEKINKSLKKYEVSHLKVGLFLKSKEIYSLFLSKNEKPKIGHLTIEETSNIFKGLHRIVKCSASKSINYKFIHNGLPCNKKFRNRYGKICYLCRRMVDETLEHIFIDCHKAKECIKNIRYNLDQPNMIINLDSLRYKINSSENDFRVFSYYISSIWNVRNIMKHTNENLDVLAIFKRFFGRWLISQTEI